MTEFTEEHKFFVVEWTPPPVNGMRLCLQHFDTKRYQPIELLRITGPCGARVTSFMMKHNSLDNTEVIWGEGTFRSENALIVKTTDAEGIERVSLLAESFALAPQVIGKPNERSDQQG
jgi:hypothetical protein